MITSKVTKEQLEKWRELHNIWKDKLTVNRISGKELDEYFRKKYNPAENNIESFRTVVYLNSEAYNKKADMSEIHTYTWELILQQDFFRLNVKILIKLLRYGTIYS